jgi:succinate-semialdehyde dehydrogenase/glutarate-semialdehyde dehydrogenase
LNTITAISPATGEIIGDFPVTSSQSIEDALKRARSAFASWQATPLATRVAPRVQRIKNILIEEMGPLVTSITIATGKPDLEALASNIFVCIDLIHYYQQNAEQILSVESRPCNDLYKQSLFEVSWEPIGVIAIFSPWNHLLQLVLVPTISALIKSE